MFDPNISIRYSPPNFVQRTAQVESITPNSCLLDQEPLLEVSSHDFFNELLSLIAQSSAHHYDKILTYPGLAIRLYNLDCEGKSSFRQLRNLVDFILQNQELVKHRSISQFISAQCVRINTQIYLVENIVTKELDLKDKIQRLLLSELLPLEIKGLLSVLLSYLELGTEFSLSTFQQQDKGLSESPLHCVPSWNHLRDSDRRHIYSFETKKKAVDAAYELDGSDFHDDSIRIWIHQPKRPGVRGGELVARQIMEFQSGRRGFIFKQCKNVPVQNYKEVMLYIIQCLKEDRVKYYEKNPEYITEEKYEGYLKGFEAKEYHYVEKEHEEERYYFEWKARKLVSLEAKIKEATEDESILNVLESFRKIYRGIPNHNMELTVATCINVSGLYPSLYQPVLFSGIPDRLRSLAQDVLYGFKGLENDTLSNKILNRLNELSIKVTYVPGSIEESFDRIKTLNIQLFQRKLARKLLISWDKSFDLREILNCILTEGKEAHAKIAENQREIAYHFIGKLRLLDPETARTELATQLDLIFAKIDDFEIDKEIVGKILAAWNKVPPLVNRLHDYLEDVRYYMKDLEAFEESFSFKPLIGCRLDGLKEKACEYLQLPFPIGDKIANFKNNLLKADFHSPDYLRNLFQSSCDLKDLMKNLLIGGQIFRGEFLVEKTLDIMDHFLLAIAKEIANRSPHDYLLLSQVGKELGYDIKEDFYLTWKQEAQKRLEPYAEVRRCIINSHQIQEHLAKKGRSIDQASQLVLGGLNTGFMAVLDSLFIQRSEDQKLLGYSTTSASLVGKLRFVSEEHFEQALPGEILVIHNASCEVHKYAGAKAIIAKQGGLFSHAAITFNHLKIPALLGCDTNALYPFNGRLIHLQLGDNPTFEVLSEDMASKIETLDAADNNLNKRLWAAHENVERKYLVEKIRKTTSPDDIITMERQISTLNIEYKTLIKSGKVENLGFLVEHLGELKSKLHLSVPEYVQFDSNHLIWDSNLELKSDIKQILAQEIPLDEKSTTICNLILKIDLDPSALLEKTPMTGPLIVRSSAKLEDRLDNAAAGIFESIVVTRPDVIHKDFLKVLASAFSEKALTIFKNQWEQLFDMQWIVQTYVQEGKYSGVAFSVVNEHEWQKAGMQVVAGLGGGVDGTQRPSHAFLDTRLGIFTDLRIATEEAPCSLEAMREIAMLVKQLEKICNAAVQIEFVGSGDRLSIVQLRPIARFANHF